MLVAGFDLLKLSPESRIVFELQRGHVEDRKCRLELTPETLLKKDLLLFFFLTAEVGQQLGVLGQLFLAVFVELPEDCNLRQVGFCVKGSLLLVNWLVSSRNFCLVRDSGTMTLKEGSFPDREIW